MISAILLFSFMGIVTLILFKGEAMKNRDNDIQSIVTQFNRYVFPDNQVTFDYKQAYDLGLNDEKDQVTDTYLQYQTRYRQYLESYLNRTLDFAGLQNELKDNQLTNYFRMSIEKVDDTESYYHSLSHLSVPYLYIRNNLYIEQLTQEEANVLKSLNKRSEKEQDEFVKATVAKVLAIGGDTSNSNHIQYFSGSAYSPIQKNALVLFVDYVDPENYREDPYFSDAQTQKRNQDEKNYVQVITRYEDVYSKQLGIPVQLYNYELTYKDRDR